MTPVTDTIASKALNFLLIHLRTHRVPIKIIRMLKTGVDAPFLIINTYSVVQCIGSALSAEEVIVISEGYCGSLSVCVAKFLFCAAVPRGLSTVQ